MKNRILTIVLLTSLVVGMAFGQTYLLNETFGTVPPTNWVSGSPAPTQGTIGYDDAYSLVFAENSSAVSIVTSPVTDPDRLSLYYRKSNNAGSGTFTVYSGPSATGPWTSLVSIPSSSMSYVQSATELSLPSGTYFFKLERASSNKKDLYIDVFQVTQSVVPSTNSLSGFFYEPSNGPSAEQSFTVSGADLTANLVLTAPTNYEISKTSASGFTSSLSYTPSSGTVASSTVYVRLKSGLSAGAYNSESITISSTGKINKIVTCNGTVGESISVSTPSLTNFEYATGSGPSAEQSFSVSGQGLTSNISITPPTNYEISTGTGGGFSATNPITLTQSGGTVSATTIYVRLQAGLSQGTYNSENITVSSTGKVSKTVTCSGSVVLMILNFKVFMEGTMPL